MSVPASRNGLEEAYRIYRSWRAGLLEDEHLGAAPERLHEQAREFALQSTRRVIRHANMLNDGKIEPELLENIRAWVTEFNISFRELGVKKRRLKRMIEQRVRLAA